MLKQILYIRHGETEWNRLGRFQGHSDIPLNESGKAQAQSLQPIINLHRPEIILSSDLQRAKLTAQIANAQLQAPLLLDPSLREVYMGLAEAKSHAEIIDLWGPQVIAEWLNPDPQFNHFSFPQGETKIQSIHRVKNFLETLLLHLPYQKFAVFGHGGTLKRFYQFVTGNQNPHFPIPNCCVYQLSFDTHHQQWQGQGEILVN